MQPCRFCSLSLVSSGAVPIISMSYTIIYDVTNFFYILLGTINNLIYLLSISEIHRFSLPICLLFRTNLFQIWLAWVGSMWFWNYIPAYNIYLLSKMQISNWYISFPCIPYMVWKSFLSLILLCYDSINAALDTIKLNEMRSVFSSF